MMRKISHKLGVMMMPPQVGACQRKPVLDVGLGYALLRDRRINSGLKVHAMLCGTGIAVVLVLMDMLLGRLLHLHASVVDPLLDGLGLVLGSALFGMLALLRIAPMDVVIKLRYERYRIIPLRTPACGMEEAEADRPKVTASRTAATPHYAVIPRRMR